MHFVEGHGQVADSPLDDDAHILYKPVSFFVGEMELVGLIVKWGRSEHSLVVSGRGADGKLSDFYVKWSPVFQRYEAVS